MKKDYLEWHKKKEKIDCKNKHIFFHEREVWWCSLGVNVGYEQDGRGDNFSRPVVILKKFNLDICLVVPLTTSKKTGKYYFSIGDVEGKNASAVLSQIRLIDQKRFFKKVEMIDEEIFDCLIDAVVSVNFKKGA